MKKNTKILLILSVFFLVAMGLSFISSVEEEEYNPPKSFIYVAISPDGSYEFYKGGEEYISDERAEFLIKKAMENKNGSESFEVMIDEIDVKIEDHTEILGTGVTLAYFKEDPVIDDSLFTTIAEATLIRSEIRLLKAYIRNQVLRGEMTEEEGRKKINELVSSSIKDSKKDYPRIKLEESKLNLK